jgi:hypothetical protein
MSTDDRVAAYLESLDAVREAATELIRIRKIIQGAAQALSQHWGRVMVDGIGIEDYPISIGLAPNVASINGQTWPTARQIADGIIAAHKAYDQTQAAWKYVPDDQRRHLAPPPSRERDLSDQTR